MLCRITANKSLQPPNSKQLKEILESIKESDNGKLKHNEGLMEQWIQYQTHFPKNIDSEMITAFLRGTKHNLDRATRKLENYLAAKHLYPEIYSYPSPFVSKDILKAMEVLNMAHFPKLSREGCRIHCFSLNIFEPSEFNMEHLVTLLFIYCDLMVMLDQPVAGHIVILDGASTQPAHMAKVFGSALKKLIILMRRVYPFRVKQIILINAPALVHKMVPLIMPLLHPKIREGVQFHKDVQTLLSKFGADIFPCDYGGELKSMREMSLDSYQIIRENIHWFEHQQNVKILQIPKTIQCDLDIDTGFGVNGSFRQLDID